MTTDKGRGTHGTMGGTNCCRNMMPLVQNFMLTALRKAR